MQPTTLTVGYVQFGTGVVTKCPMKPQAVVKRERIRTKFQCMEHEQKRTSAVGQGMFKGVTGHLAVKNVSQW
jgi:hypothetical protein